MLKKNDKVRVKRNDKYFSNKVGVVVSVDSNYKYGVSVRFSEVSYQNTNTSNYQESELEKVE